MADMRIFSLLILTTQIFITALHVIVYKYTLLWFPELYPYKLWLLSSLVVMSFAFTVAMPLSMKLHKYQRLIDMYVHASSLWLGSIAIFFLVIAVSAGITLILDALHVDYSYHLVGEYTFGVALLLNILSLWNTYHLHKRTYKVADPRVPKNWHESKIVMIADVHIGRIRTEKWVQKVVAAINLESPDIVLIVGDLYDGPEVATVQYQDLLAQIHATRGVFFVNGNHEKYGDLSSFKDSVRGAGITILEDASSVIDGLEFVGIDYRTEELYDMVPGTQGIYEVISKIRTSPYPKIYLKHIPMNLNQIATDQNAILSVHGHTHRGQMFPFNFVTSIMYKGYDYGHKKYMNTHIITTSGAGSWGPPQRLYSQTEYVVITLHRE